MLHLDLVRGESPKVMTRSVSVVLQAAGPPSPDFNGDGVVDFPDLVLFAGAFGYGEGDERYEGRYDLNGDGEGGRVSLVVSIAITDVAE